MVHRNEEEKGQFTASVIDYNNNIIIIPLKHTQNFLLRERKRSEKTKPGKKRDGLALIG